MTLYGSPVLQAMVGLGSDDAKVRRQIGDEVIREAAAQERLLELRRVSIAAGYARPWFAPCSASNSGARRRRRTSAPLTWRGKSVPSVRRAGG